MEERKQRQIGRLIRETLGEYFQREGFALFGSAMVTIVDVSVLPDGKEARVFVSVYNAPDKDSVLLRLNEWTGLIRKWTGNRLRHKLRLIPRLQFSLDNTLDQVFRIEELLKQAKQAPEPPEEKPAKKTARRKPAKRTVKEARPKKRSR